MKRLVLACCLGLLTAAPAGAVDPLNGDWFILTGGDQVVASDPEHPVVKLLTDWAKVADLDYFTIAPPFGVYAQLGGYYYGADFADAPFQKVHELWESHKIANVAVMAQGGWLVVYDKNDFAADGIPAGARAALEEARRDGGTIRSMAFAPDGGWVLLLGAGFKEEGVPDDLRRTLAEHYQKGVAVRCVTFTSQGDWFLLDDGNECFSSNTAHPAFRKLLELRSQGRALKWLAFTPGEYTHGYALEHRPVRRVRAVTTYDLSEPDGVRGWVLCAPQPPELYRQRDVQAALDRPARTVEGPSPPDRKLLVGLVTDEPKRLRGKLTYEVTLYTSRLVPRLRGAPAGKAELTAEELAWYTRADTATDYDAAPFQQFLDRAGLRRGAAEGDMTFARRAYQYLRTHFRWAITGSDARASTVCQAGQDDCGGLSTLFVAVMRANRVPARALLGEWAASEAPPAKPGDPPQWPCHVEAEFFVRGVGWVPVNLGIAAPDDPTFAFFGNDPGDFLALDHAADLSVDTFPGEPPTPVGPLQGLTWWQAGGSGHGEHAEMHWTVDTIEEHPAATPPPRRPRATYPAPSAPKAFVLWPRPSAAERPPDHGVRSEPASPATAADDQKETAGDKAVVWLLLAPIAGGPAVLLAGLLLLKRRRRVSRRSIE